MTQDEKTASLNGLRHLLKDYRVDSTFAEAIEKRFGGYITDHIDNGVDPVTGCAFRPSGLKSTEPAPEFSPSALE